MYVCVLFVMLHPTFTCRRSFGTSAPIPNRRLNHYTISFPFRLSFRSSHHPPPSQRARLLHVGMIVTIQLVIYDFVKQLVGLPATGAH